MIFVIVEQDPKMYTSGDLVIVSVNETESYGEVLGIEEGTGHLEVSFLKKTPVQDGRIWQFAADDEWETVVPLTVTKHVPVPEGSDGHTVAKAWKSVGFVASGDGITFCRCEDEHLTTLDMLMCEEDSDDEEGTPSSNANMHGYEDDGFVVPDDEGEEFDFADPSTLDKEGAAFVLETHKAVHDFDKWYPKDKQGQGIKQYIDNMDRKASIQTDNHRFTNGKSSISTSKPPLKRKR